MKPKISLCMIVKDEEKFLGKCLSPIKNAVDEIIIVDTGSKDKTKETAKEFTKKIYNFKWNDDFSKARNLSISKATKEWILVLDADEKIVRNDLIKLRRIIQQQQKPLEAGGGELNLRGIKHEVFMAFFRKFMASKWRVGYMPKHIRTMGYRLIQKTYYNNKVISIRGICRLFKNNKKIKFIYPIHETVRESIKQLGGRIEKTGIIIKHYPKISKEKQNYYIKLLKIKKEKFPQSNVDKEIENEYNLFNPR